MYESFFGFRQRPFAAVPRPEFFFPAESIELARQTLLRCIERGEGPALVIGASGLGKSLLCDVLADQLGNKFRVATLATARLCTRRGLLQNILFELGLPYRDMEEGELRLLLVDHLDPDRHDNPPLLLLIDEAHALPLRLLEEVRMITNLVRHGQPRVRLVLAGGTALEERFAMPRLASFNQRLAARCYLDSLGRDETFSYVRFQIERAGASDEIFTQDALEAVYHASGGVPRLVNQVCDHALILARAGGKRQIDSAGVEEAWADLQQLPAPQLGDEVGEGSRQVIEFGQLDDLDDEPSSAPAAASHERDFHVVSPEEQLDEIEQQLASVDDAVFEEPVAAPATKSGVELQFHAAHNPFAEEFAEEEIVVDRYATLEAAMAGRPRVKSRQGQEIAALLPKTPPANIEPRQSSVTVIEEELGPVQPLRPLELKNETKLADELPPAAEPAPAHEDDLETDDLEMVYSFSGEEQAASPEPEPQPVSHRGDDRDLIDVEDDPAGARREDYRNLFSRLRQDD